MPEEKNAAVKVLTVSAIVTGVGFGMCSLGAVSGVHWLGFTIYLGAVMFFAGLAVLVLTALVMLVQALLRLRK